MCIYIYRWIDRYIYIYMENTFVNLFQKISPTSGLTISNSRVTSLAPAPGWLAEALVPCLTCLGFRV